MDFRFNRALREDSHLSRAGWSEWKKAMVPSNNNYNKRFLERRGRNQSGFVWLNLIRELDEVQEMCGIYEWKAARNDLPSGRVVYVGSTCSRRGQCDLLQNRIFLYCKNGSHKEDVINDTLDKGYELFVRYKQARNEDEAKEMENELLDRYDYAWNVRRNTIRNVLPRAFVASR